MGTPRDRLEIIGQGVIAGLVGCEEFPEPGDHQLIGDAGKVVEETGGGRGGEPGVAALQVALELFVEIEGFGSGSPFDHHARGDGFGLGRAAELGVELIHQHVVGAVCDHPDESEAHVADREGVVLENAVEVGPGVFCRQPCIFEHGQFPRIPPPIIDEGGQSHRDCEVVGHDRFRSAFVGEMAEEVGKGLGAPFDQPGQGLEGAFGGGGVR